MIREINSIKFDTTALEIFAECNGVAQFKRSLEKYGAHLVVTNPPHRSFVMPGQEKNLTHEEIIKKVVEDLYFDLAVYIETHDDLYFRKPEG